MTDSRPVSTIPLATADKAGPTERTTLIDKFGRQVSYVRLSVTDRCDFRCHYCMARKMKFLPREAVMSLEECLCVARVFVGLGVDKLRVTGGEPLVRKGLLYLLERLAALPGLDELTMTTNASQLERYATALRDAGVARLNISLDTLKPERFRSITRIGDLGKVLAGIRSAQRAGFLRTKLNTVMMRGVNDDEYVDLLAFAIDEGLDISFIEEMPMGDINGREMTYISSGETRQGLAEKFTLLPSDETSSGPARYWRVNGSNTRVGFISPHSHNFCADCNRLRITAKGDLYPCLGQNDFVPLLPIMRSQPGDNISLHKAIIDCMGIKPFGHEFSSQMENPQVARFMSTTGG